MAMATLGTALAAVWGMDVPRIEFKKQQADRRKWQIAAGVVALAVVTVGLFSLKPAAPEVERGAIWIDTVKRGELLRQVRGPGTLVPKEIRWIAAESDGRAENEELDQRARHAQARADYESATLQVEAELVASASCSRGRSWKDTVGRSRWRTAAMVWDASRGSRSTDIRDALARHR